MKFTPLITFCSSLEPVSDELIDMIKQNAIPIKIPKKTQLFPLGVAEDKVIFITSGTLRKYAVVENKQITLSLYSDNDIIGFAEMSHYLDNEFLETIFDSELVLLPKTFIANLYEYYPEMHRIAAKVLSIKYQKLVQESRLSRLPTADHRYSLFASSIGKFKLPARILASYLVMREETLSRLKARHKKNQEI